MAQGLTLQQLQAMGAKPVGQQAPPTSSTGTPTKGKGLTLQQLQQMGATPVGTTLPPAGPEQPQEAQPGILDTISGGIDKAYDVYKNLPGIKQASQVVGGAVGTVGGGIGLGVGALGEGLRQDYNLLTGKGYDVGKIGQSALRTAKDTAQFGYDIGKEGTAAAPLGGAGRVINTALGLNQLYESGKNFKQAIETGDTAKAVTSGIEGGVGLFGLHGAIHSPTNFPDFHTPEFYSNKGKSIMREMINPGKGEIKKFEIKQGKSLDEIAGNMAKEGVKPQVKDSKLDFQSDIGTQHSKVSAEKAQLDSMLEKVDKKVSLVDVFDRVNKQIDSLFKNATEANDAKAAAAELLNAELGRHGTIEPTIKQANDIKSGMWKVGYRADKPMQSRVARMTGHAITDAMDEAGMPELAKRLNKSMSNRMDMISVMENATGRIVKGGRLGDFGARLLGGYIGGHAGPVGGIIGQEIGHRVGKSLRETGPARAAKKAGLLMEKADKMRKG